MMMMMMAMMAMMMVAMMSINYVSTGADTGFPKGGEDIHKYPPWTLPA